MRKVLAIAGIFAIAILMIAPFATPALAAPNLDPEERVLMHHCLGNGECQEKYVLPGQVADNPEWEIGPCPEVPACVEETATTPPPPPTDDTGTPPPPPTDDTGTPPPPPTDDTGTPPPTTLATATIPVSVDKPNHNPCDSMYYGWSKLSYNDKGQRVDGNGKVCDDGGWDIWNLFIEFLFGPTE